MRTKETGLKRSQSCVCLDSKFWPPAWEKIKCGCCIPVRCGTSLVQASPATTENTGHLWKGVCCCVSQESVLQSCMELQGFYGRVRKESTEHRLQFWKWVMGMPSRILHQQEVGWRRMGSKRFWLWRSMHGSNCWTNLGDFCKVQGTLRCCEVRHSRKVAHICSHRIPLREPAKRVFMHANNLVYSTVGRGGSDCYEFISDKQSFNRQWSLQRRRIYVVIMEKRYGSIKATWHSNHENLWAFN